MLANQGLGKYTDVFLRHEIDLPTFATLNDEELKMATKENMKFPTHYPLTRFGIWLPKILKCLKLI